MHRQCCFFCQTSASKVPGLILHNFPKDLSRRNTWLKRCGYTEEEFLPYNKLCSLHFNGNSYKTTKLRKLLKNNAIPTKFKKMSKFNFVECQQSSLEMTMNISNKTVACKQSSSEMTMNVSVQRKNNLNFVNTRLHYLMLAVECELSKLETKMNVSDQIKYEQSSLEMTTNVSDQIECDQSSSEITINVSV